MVLFVSTVMYLAVVKGGQIDVKNCKELGRGGGRFYSPGTGNKVGVSVTSVWSTSDDGTIYYNLSGFLQQDLTDGVNTEMYNDMSDYKNCRLSVEGGLAKGSKAYIFLYYAEIDPDYPNETEDIYECEVLEWSGMANVSRLLLV